MNNAGSLYTRIGSIIDSYTSESVEVSPGVRYSQYELINRIYRFRNRDLDGIKINEDLSYNYFFDIIQPRVNNNIKNLRFDSKNVMVFSNNYRRDFAAIYISNASMKLWMAENGEDEKLKEAVEEFVSMGNVVFKRVGDTYALSDLRNLMFSNTTAKTLNDTDLIERYELSASQLKAMSAWDGDVIDDVIGSCANTTFKATNETMPIASTSPMFEIFEFTGEVSEKEYNQALDRMKGKSSSDKGDAHKYFLARIVIAGLRKGQNGSERILFCQKFPEKKKISDYYKEAHYGSYTGRWMRVGVTEMLFDDQIRANEIGQQLASALEWASKAIFQTSDSNVLQNMKADLMNGDVVTAKDLRQLEVRSQGLDQLIADWNRVLTHADALTNSFEVVSGESLPSGTAFRMGVLLDQNAGKLFTFLRQKITLPYKRVFREWVLPELIKDLEGKDIIEITGDADMLDQLREIAVRSWYMQNLVYIGPHTQQQGEQIMAAELESMKQTDPSLKNSKKIWEGVLKRLLVTITGENYTIDEQLSDLMNVVGNEEDPTRRAFVMDLFYKARGIPIPPKPEPSPQQSSGVQNMMGAAAQVQTAPEGSQQVAQQPMM